MALYWLLIVCASLHVLMCLFTPRQNHTSGCGQILPCLLRRPGKQCGRPQNKKASLPDTHAAAWSSTFLLFQPLCASFHFFSRPLIISRVEGRNLVERFDSERCFLSKLHISAAPPEEQPDCPGARISAGKVFKKYMERKKPRVDSACWRFC